MCPNDLLREKADAVKLIVCDLDGTLLDSRKLISPASLEAIRALGERSIAVTICTGRIPEMMEAYSRFLGIEGLCVAANGAVILDSRSGETPVLRCADGDEAGRLLAFCAERGFDHIAATMEGCYYSEGSVRIKRFEQYNDMARTGGLGEIPLYPFGGNYGGITGVDIYKVLVSELSGAERRETEAFTGGLPHLDFTSSEPGLLDVGAAAVNKGSALKELARLMGLRTEQICVFGDYQNDIPMFEAAGFSIAMENADETVKSRADAVTGTNDENGVAVAIKKYFL